MLEIAVRRAATATQGGAGAAIAARTTNPMHQVRGGRRGRAAPPAPSGGGRCRLRPPIEAKRQSCRSWIQQLVKPAGAGEAEQLRRQVAGSVHAGQLLAGIEATPAHQVRDGVLPHLAQLVDVNADRAGLPLTPPRAA